MKSKAFLFRFVLVIAMFAITSLIYPKLPDMIPIHWNLQGQADGWGDKVWAAWLMPGIALILIFLFPLLAKIDPRHKNYEKFSGTYEVIQTVIILFFGFFFFLQYYFTFYPENSHLMLPMILGMMGVFFIILGNYMGKVRQNYFVGLRTPWTLSDPEVWQKSQRVTGWFFVIGGLVFLIEAWLQLYLTVVFIFTIATIVLVPVIYSYVLYRKKELKAKR